MRLRIADDHDVYDILEAVETFVSASTYQKDRFDAEKVAQTIKTLISHPDALVVVMEGDAGIFAGCFVGLAHDHLISCGRMLGELFIYTTPDARGHGGKLRLFAEQWARENGCDSFMLAYPVSEARLEKVYRRWGFEPHEVHFRKGLN